MIYSFTSYKLHRLCLSFKNGEAKSIYHGFADQTKPSSIMKTQSLFRIILIYILTSATIVLAKETPLLKGYEIDQLSVKLTAVGFRREREKNNDGKTFVEFTRFDREKGSQTLYLTSSGKELLRMEIYANGTQSAPKVELRYIELRDLIFNLLSFDAKFSKAAMDFSKEHLPQQKLISVNKGGVTFSHERNNMQILQKFDGWKP